MDDNRSPSFEENDLKKGPWTPDEDEKLIQHIQKHGLGSWRALPKLAGLNRCGKSCRLRWTNYLRPDIKRGKFSEDEEQMILHLHSILGNKWSAIATHLPGRTDNEIKNFWNTHLKKKLIQMGFDPMTHQPRSDLMAIPNLPHLMALANLKHHLLMKNNPVDLQLLHSLLLLQSSTPTNDMIQQNGGNDVVPADHHQTEVPLFMENNPGLFSHDHHDDYEYNNYYYYHDGSSSTSTTSPQPLHQYPDLLSHPDPQKVSFSFQPSLNNDHDHLDHEHEIIMGQQQSNISDHSFTNMISTDGLQGDYPPHDHDHHDDHDSASTWFLPPLSPSSSNLPNLIECEGLVCNNINITPAGDHATSSTTTNLHWPAELFHDDSI